jgi:hypothetical protein
MYIQVKSLTFAPMPAKQSIHEACVRMVTERIQRAEAELRQLSEAAQEETKSSAGDKYETGREMITQEKVKWAEQLADAQKMKQALDQLKPNGKVSVIAPGAMAKTSMGTFYISVSLGKVEVDNQEWLVISPVSPIGMALMNHQAGDRIPWNNNGLVVMEVS